MEWGLAFGILGAAAAAFLAGGGSSIGVPILDHSLYPEQDHEQTWSIFPSIYSATGRAVRANPQVTRRTILTFRRFHKLLSEA